jgi:hypothetical protein
MKIAEDYISNILTSEALTKGRSGMETTSRIINAASVAALIGGALVLPLVAYLIG